MPQGTNQGIQSTMSQHNQRLGKVKSASHCRKETFKDIVKHAKSFDKPVDVMIGGDYNQDIASTEVQQFFNELQIKDVHQMTNVIEIKEMDHTHSRGTKCIGSFAETCNVRKHIEGCSIYQTNEIINTDHRSHAIDVNLEDYFLEEFSEWDKIERGVMDPNKRTHREKFNELMNEALDSFPM